ncbi:hypothetical protein [Sphingobacterium sp.]|uniref:hypothetical protein n=1 Tax=Sphingobacterium sp. TaxID=341027 RepID=UPI00289DB045|nr:hypothetical protein [Sphingobacterium sp.]
MENINYIHGKQYPYGFKDWLRKCAFNLQDRFGCFPETPRCDAWSRIDPESWLPLFNEGLSPFDAVSLNMKA